jgi:hypothetical protein
MRQRPTTVYWTAALKYAALDGEIGKVAFLAGKHDSMARRRIPIAAPGPRIT